MQAKSYFFYTCITKILGKFTIIFKTFSLFKTTVDSNHFLGKIFSKKLLFCQQ